MLKFLVFKAGQPMKDIFLHACHLVGPDEVPVSGSVQFVDGQIVCEKPANEAVALALMWEVKGKIPGKYLLQTTRLTENDKPYILNVELARWRLMRGGFWSSRAQSTFSIWCGLSPSARSSEANLAIGLVLWPDGGLTGAGNPNSHRAIKRPNDCFSAMVAWHW